MKPKISCGPDSWVLSTELDPDVTLELKIRGSVRKVFVTLGSVVHYVKPLEYETLGNKYDLPIAYMVKVLEDKWKLLNLIAEF